MSRPLTRTQALENRAFLKLLRRTGNVRLACRALGLKYGTIQHRRRVHAAFAARWDAAVVFAQAGLMKTYAKEGLGHASESRDHVGRARLPSGSPPRRPAGAVSSHNDARSAPLTLCSAAGDFAFLIGFRLLHAGQWQNLSPPLLRFRIARS